MKQRSVKNAVVILAVIVAVYLLISYVSHLQAPVTVSADAGTEYSGEVIDCVDKDGKEYHIFVCSNSQDYVAFMNKSGIKILGASIRLHRNRSVRADSYTVTYEESEASEDLEKLTYNLIILNNEEQMESFFESHSMAQVLNLSVYYDDLVLKNKTYYVTYAE